MDGQEASPQRSSDDASDPGPNPTEVLASLSAREVLTMLPAGELSNSDPAPRAFARASSLGKSSDGAGGSSPRELTSQEREALTSAKERGNKLFSSQLYGEAASAYTEALRYARAPDDVATLLSNRSASYASLSRMYRSRPARRSECAALFDLDPTSLAQMALKDADRAVAVRPGWAKAHSRQGTALFLLERYHEAREAFLEGLAVEPTSQALQEGLREVQAVLLGDGDADGSPAGTTTTTAAATAAGGAGAAATDAAPGGSSAANAAAAGAQPLSPVGSGGGGAAAANASAVAASKRQRTMGSGAGRAALDDWDCALCAKLLYEPVTTPCGHTFCRECFARAIDHKPRCPYCRTVLHVARDALPVTITLANIISKAFPEEYEERRREAAGAAAPAAEAAADPAASAVLSLPLFVMSLLMPGETMALNIFEPRYRLMVRRVMEGSRRLGMAQARRDHQEIEDVAVEAEILECQPQPDGRYYLELVGRRRVRILSHGELDGYRVARCELMQDTDPQPGTPAHDALPELVAQVGRQVDSVLTQLGALAAGHGRLSMRVRALLDGLGERPPPAQPEKFSMWAATVACSLLPDLDKATVLRGTDTAQRLRQLQERLGSRMSAGGGPQGCAVM